MCNTTKAYPSARNACLAGNISGPGKACFMLPQRELGCWQRKAEWKWGLGGREFIKIRFNNILELPFLTAVVTVMHIS